MKQTTCPPLRMGIPFLVLFLALSGCLRQTLTEDDSVVVDHDSVVVDHDSVVVGHDSVVVGHDHDSDLTGIRFSSFFNQGTGKEWVKVYGKGALSDQKTPSVKSPGSMLLTAQENSSTIIERTLASPLDLCDEPNVSIKIAVSSPANLKSLAALTLTMISGTGYMKSASYNPYQYSRELYLMPTQRWIRINMASTTFKPVSGYDCSKVSRIHLALNTSQAGPDSLSLGKLSFYPNPLDKAVLLITEDDQWTNFETNGLPAMRKHSFPATIYVNGGLLGSGTKMTLESLKKLQDSAGWTIANHMWLHDSITNLSNDSAASSIRHNSEFLKAAGFTGYSHFAYPYGLVDREKDSVVRATCASARLVLGWAEGEPFPFSDSYRLHPMGFLDHKITLEVAKAALNQLVRFRTVGIVGVHEIVTEGPLDTRKWLKSDWEALLDYIAVLVDQGQLRVLSLEDFYEQYHPGPL